MMNTNIIQQLPFNNEHNVISDEHRETFLDITDMNNTTIEDLNDRYDRSILTRSDPDINALLSNDSLYYNDKTFDVKCQGNKNLSFIHINIHSAPKN